MTLILFFNLGSKKAALKVNAAFLNFNNSL